MVNTNARDHGDDPTERMLNAGVAAIWGYKTQGATLENSRPEKGDIIFAYHNGRGFIARGVVQDGEIKRIPNPTTVFVRCKDTNAWSIDVQWERFPGPGTAVTCAEGRKAIGPWGVRNPGGLVRVHTNAQQKLAYLNQRWNLDSPTANRADLNRRVNVLLDEGLIEKPVGSQHPEKTEGSTGTAYKRSPKVKAYTLQEAKGKCESCHQAGPFHRSDGSSFLEVHHVKRLSEDGPDTPENTVAVCPNCHRGLHFAVDKTMRTERLYQRIGRLARC
jgi:hypothetical protein